MFPRENARFSGVSPMRAQVDPLLLLSLPERAAVNRDGRARIVGRPMKTFVLGIVLSGVLAAGASAQTVAQPFGAAAVRRAVAEAWPAAPAAEQTPAAEASPRVTVLVGADMPTLYFFRGIRQEADSAFTLQPFVDVGFAASDRVTVNVGLWNSVHTGTSGTGCDCDASALYETDFYVSATFAAGKVKPGVLFTAYTSPNDFFPAVHELAFFASFDDSAMAVPLSPKVTLATEIAGDGSADLGSTPAANRGTYLEFAVRPSFALGTRSATLAVPARVGLSVRNYYEMFHEDGSLTDSTFGFFQIGAQVGVPIGEAGGASWEVHGGVDVYTFGDNTLRVLNEGDKAKAVASFGLSGSF